MHTPRLRIAVIGAGISGLASAWLLSRRYAVTLYERNDYLGGHTHTHEVETADGRRVAVDSGFIVYNEPNYPLFTAMLRHLGVATQATDMSFAAALDGGRLEYAGSSLNGLFAQRRNLLRPGHWRMLRDILRFNATARADLANPAALPADLTLDDYLRRGGYGPELARDYLLPMGAAIWSCPAQTMREFPAASLLRFFNNHGLIQLRDRPAWRTLCNGSRQYVHALREQLGEVHPGQAVEAVWRDPGGVWVAAAGGEPRLFDAAVLASHADQSLAMLRDPGAVERELLSAFAYQPNRALLHRDPGLMPRRRRAWASWNYLSERGGDDLAVSYWMNRLQRLPTDEPLIVTLNPPREPAPGTLIAEMHYQHPVFDTAALRAQARLDEIQGRDRLWFAGAWTGYGFHEDGLRSAVAVARRLGVGLPWVAGHDAGTDAAPGLTIAPTASPDAALIP